MGGCIPQDWYNTVYNVTCCTSETINLFFLFLIVDRLDELVGQSCSESHSKPFQSSTGTGWQRTHDVRVDFSVITEISTISMKYRGVMQYMTGSNRAQLR